MDRTIIETYAQGGERLKQAFAGLTPEQLAWIPPKDAGVGLWSIQQIVLHLADAEAAFADRLKRIIAMDEPSLLAWDENKFIEKLYYDEQSADDAATIFEATRRQMTRVLCKLPDAAFQRAGMHSERGRQTMLDVLGYATWHLDHHLEFVEKKRAKLAK